MGLGVEGAASAEHPLAGPSALDGSSELSPIVVADRLTAAERSVLGEMIARNIESAWAPFHTADTQRMMAVGRTQLYMLKQHRTQLDPSTMPPFYSAAYRLLGATYHRRGLYQEALRAHDSAYLAALEGGDVWNMAETRAWQAHGRGHECRDSS